MINNEKGGINMKLFNKNLIRNNYKKFLCFHYLILFDMINNNLRLIIAIVFNKKFN